MSDNKLGQMLKAARGKQTLREYAAKIGISHTHLDSIERGYDPRTGKRVNITATTLQKISEATGIDISAFYEENAEADAQKFAQRIRAIRKEKGLTQEQFGTLVGKADSTVRAWELGAAFPTCKALIEIVRKTGVTSDYLLGITNESEVAGK